MSMENYRPGIKQTANWQEIRDKVRHAALEGIDGALAAYAFPKDEDLPALFKAIDAVTANCLKRAGFSTGTAQKDAQ